MVEKKKLFLSLCIFGSILNATPAVSLDNNDAILVKVHDIKPVKNERGITTHCEFMTTIHNRTSSDMSGINIELNWFDEAVKDAMEQEKSMDTSNMRRTQDFISSDIRTSINVPVLQKNTQKSIPSKINNNRCFVLMEDAEINVKTCKANTTNKKDDVACTSLFTYVSSKSPEYYTEFLNVSLDEQKKKDAQDKAKISGELDKIFKTIEDNMQKTSRLLTTTFAPVAPMSSSAVNVPDVPSPMNADAQDTVTNN